MSFRRWGSVIGLLVCGAVSSVAAVAAQDPRTPSPVSRIASINLCTDSMLLELAPPSRITSVTWLARDPAVSFWSEKAKQVAANRGNAEELLSQQPDLVLVGSYTANASKRMLARFGVPMLSFEPVTSIAEFKASFRRLANAIGLSAEAEARLGEMDRRLLASAKTLPPGMASSLSAVVFGANGSTIGQASLLSDILYHAGFDNMADQLQVNPLGNVPLEWLLIADPDVLIFSELNPEYPSLAEQVMSHRVLRLWRQDNFSGAGHPKTSVVLPARYSNCGGTFIAEAVARLARHRATVSAR